MGSWAYADMMGVGADAARGPWCWSGAQDKTVVVWGALIHFEQGPGEDLGAGAGMP